jgi:Kinesin motor domain
MLDSVPNMSGAAVAGGSVNSRLAAQAALAQGHASRTTHATRCNDASSRSHELLSFRVASAADAKAGSFRRLNLVDLAGSERIGKSKVAGQQLAEAQAINKSLSALGDVIAALQERSPHVPYRNSKLTAVLQDSLCGDSKVRIATTQCAAALCEHSLYYAEHDAHVVPLFLGFDARVADGGHSECSQAAAACRCSSCATSCPRRPRSARRCRRSALRSAPRRCAQAASGYCYLATHLPTLAAALIANAPAKSAAQRIAGLPCAAYNCTM